MSNREEKLKQADEFLDGLKSFAGDKLSQEEDIKRIVTAAFREDKLEELEKLAFSAKYAVGLMRIIRTRDNTFEEDYFEKIKTEYGENLEKVKRILGDLAESEGGFISSIFDEKYFRLNHTSLDNLNILCRDLEFVKQYLNELKYNSK